MNSKRFVFDSNLLVSALLFKNSKPRRALNKAFDILSRKKFNKYLSENEKKIFLSMIFREAELIEISEKIQICRDPKDDKYLETAVNGKAKFIVTGDNDLLILNSFKNVDIVTPDQFLALDLA